MSEPDWLGKYLAERERADRAEILLRQFAEGRDLRRAENIRALGEKVKRLRREVRSMQVKAEELNTTAWATGLIVHCTGCEAGGPARPEGVTEEKVAAVEKIARRLRTWWNGHLARRQREATR